MRNRFCRAINRGAVCALAVTASGVVVLGVMHLDSVGASTSPVQFSHIRNLPHGLALAGVTLAPPAPALVAVISEAQADATALALSHEAAAREAVLATVTMPSNPNGPTCYCWVVDVTPPGYHHLATKQDVTAPTPSDANFRLVFIDARSGVEWSDLGVG